MNSEEQAAGEARVREMLVKGLMRQGLAKPGGLTKDQFAEMIDDLCQRLAYMNPVNLAALAEDAVALAGGKDKDRFPLAKALLARAAEIEPPPDTGSPLMRAVFSHALGDEAIAQGWAPELLFWLRRNRRFPNAFAARQIREEAEDPIRTLREIEGRLARDGEIDAAATRFRDRRLAQIALCRKLADLGRADREVTA